MSRYGCQTMVGRLRRVVLKHPREAYLDQAKIEREWGALGYPAPPDLGRAVATYDAFAALLQRCGAELHYLRADGATLDAIYTHDPALVTQRGAVLCRMGKAARQPEPEAMRAFFEQTGVPVLGAVTDPGLLEGGDVVWLDERTVAVGQGYRTNAEGIRQLAALLGDLVDEVIPVPLPHWHGPGAVLHLMSILSPADRDLAVVYSPLMPVPFRQRLVARGMELVEVPEAEYATMACNVLAVAPRECIMLDGNPRTRALLEDAGATVWTYDGSEISRKGDGGPTCLTRPIWRT